MISIWEFPLFTATDSTGCRKTMGLHALFENAADLRELNAGSFTGKMGLIRLCLAFLMDIYHPETQDDLADLFETGHFDMQKIDAYIRSCEADGVCFALDDPEKPFMQAAYDPDLDLKSEKSAANLLFDVPSGNNHIHLDHRRVDEHVITTATALENMLATYTFCTSGTAGPSNVNNTPPVMALLYGRNLFETLVLNMVSEDALGGIPYGEPMWRNPVQIIPKQQTPEMSLLLALTWMPRRITLKWDADGKIRNVYLQAGLDFRGNEQWMDPYALYRKSKEEMMVTIKPILGREMWRDAGTLTALGTRFRSTLPVMNYGEVWETDRPVSLDVELGGLITNQAAILGVTSERLKLPEVLLRDPVKGNQFYGALAVSEQVWNDLTYCTRCEFMNDSKSKKNGPVADEAGERYLFEIRRFLFGTYMDQLTGIAEDHLKVLFDGVLEALNTALKTVVEASGNDFIALRRQINVSNEVLKRYYKLRKENVSE